MVYDLQKASFWKRIAAWLFDSILTMILAVGIAFLLSSALDYDEYSNLVSDTYTRYETEYGVSFDITQEEYLSWSAEKQQAFDTAYQALSTDEDAIHAYNMVVNLTMLIASLSILVSVSALEFVVPLLFKEGRTLGKAIFSLCVVRTDCVRVNTMQLFVRTILGKFTIETMIPVYLLLMLYWGITDLTGTLVLGALLLAQLIILIATKKNSGIHDLLAGTAVADYASQMIFPSEADLIEYQKKAHAERAAKERY